MNLKKRIDLKINKENDFIIPSIFQAYIKNHNFAYSK